MGNSTMVIDFENGGQEKLVDEDGGEVRSGVEMIDASTDPTRYNELTEAALSGLDENIPFPGPAGGACSLKAGYIDADGKRWSQAEVRELTGRDEELIGKAYATNDLTRYIDTILQRGTVAVGPVSGDGLSKALDTLLIGDRDLLLMQIRRATFGDTLRLNVKCPFCEEEFQVDYSFTDDVPVNDYPNDAELRSFDIELPSGKQATVQPMTGAVQKRVFTLDNQSKTPAELNTLVLAECIDSIGGRKVAGTGPVLDMSIKDRAHVIEWLPEQQPGPRYDKVTQDCPRCEREFPLVVDVVSMFR